MVKMQQLKAAYLPLKGDRLNALLTSKIHQLFLRSTGVPGTEVKWLSKYRSKPFTSKGPDLNEEPWLMTFVLVLGTLWTV